MNDAAPQRSRFASIEIARGVAALLVVFHHAGRIVMEPRFYGSGLPMQYLLNLNVGVDFFFVLSGFIITWVHWDDIGTKGKLGGYARKRFLRIYPPYWGVLVPLTLLYLAVPGSGDWSKRDPLNILLSIFLLPNTVQPVLGVAWTLTHEMFFYVLFALAIARGVNVLRGMAVWAASIVVAGFLLPSLPFPLSFFFSPFNLEFILGVGTAAYLKRHHMPAPRTTTILATIAFGLVLFLVPTAQDNALVGRLIFGGLSALFVLGAVETERTRPFNPGRIALLMGGAVLRGLSGASRRALIRRASDHTNADAYACRGHVGHGSVRYYRRRCLSPPSGTVADSHSPQDDTKSSPCNVGLGRRHRQRLSRLVQAAARWRIAEPKRPASAP